jgi:hypothetical protein
MPSAKPSTKKRTREEAFSNQSNHNVFSQPPKLKHNKMKPQHQGRTLNAGAGAFNHRQPRHMNNSGSGPLNIDVSELAPYIKSKRNIYNILASEGIYNKCFIYS